MPFPRFQFRLRTLLIVVALLAILCAYVAQQYRLVAARKAWLIAHQTPRGIFEWNGPGMTEHEGNREDGPGLIRRWLGDRAWHALPVVDPKPGEVEVARELFPETTILECYHHPPPLTPQQ